MAIEFPDIRFAGFYFPDIIRALLAFKRQHAPEITEETQYEPFIAALRAFGLTGHWNMSYLDHAARESFIDSARLVESVRKKFKLIGYEVAGASPASVRVLMKMTKLFTTTVVLFQKGAQASTEETVDTPLIPFEYLEEDNFSLERTDQIKAAFALEDDVFSVDHAVDLNTPSLWTPWATPLPGDMLYLCHGQAMWDVLLISVSTVGEGIEGGWEFYDGSLDDGPPDGVTDLGGSLEFVIDGIFGSTTNYAGATVRVTHKQSGAFQEVASSYSVGSQNVAVTGLLGQASPSTNPEDYAVGLEWHPFFDALDNTDFFTVNGSEAVVYTLPQLFALFKKDWLPTTVNGVEGFWLRYRIRDIAVPTRTSPTLLGITIVEGDQYVYPRLTQGELHIETLGISNGQPDQTFDFSNSPYIGNSGSVQIDSTDWEIRDSFLLSASDSRHVVLDVNTDGEVTVRFGNGINGRIPTAGAGITSEYRTGAENDGNVGSDAITENKTGFSFVRVLGNPFAASGWLAARGETPRDLQLLKLEGPASLRTIGRAITAPDAVYLAKAYRTSSGSALISRAIGIEELYGPNTVGLICVAPGGGTLDSDQIAELEDYFNLDPTDPDDESVVVMNHQVRISNYRQKVINTELDVRAEGVSQGQIEAAVRGLIDPEAIAEDEVNYQWEFGEKVPLSMIDHIVHRVDVAVLEVDILAPLVDTALNYDELPIAGTVVVNLV